MLYYIYLTFTFCFLLGCLKCTFQPFIHYFSKSEVILQIHASLNSCWVYYALILHWIENDSEKDNNDLTYGVVLQKVT